MFDRRLIQCFNWGLLGLTFLLGFFGLGVLCSAVMAGGATPQKILFTKQSIWYCAGLILMFISLLFNYKMLERWAYAIYTACFFLLIYVLLFGKYVGGARRWIALGPVSIQPSELAKIVVIIILAKYY